MTSENAAKMRSQVKFLFACSLLLVSGNVMLARSSAYLPYLNGITAVAYRPFYRRCEIDRYAWKASIDVIASRSGKLRFIPDEEYNVHLALLRTSADDLANSAVLSDEGTKAFNVAEREFREYNDIPKLILSVISIKTTNECIGRVIGTLELTSVTPVKRLWHEDRVIPERRRGTVTRIEDDDVWNSKQNYTARLIEVGELIINLLVEDWTAAQLVPADGAP
jgi:hypothetical protein